MLQDTAIHTHFKDKLDCGLERNLSCRPEPSAPTKVPFPRILKVLDGSVAPGTLSRTLNSIDTRISNHFNARSGSHGYAARGYPQTDKSRFPLDWKEVSELRDEAVKAAMKMVDDLDETEAAASRQSEDYGSILWRLTRRQ